MSWAQQAFTASDVVELYLHRSAFETAPLWKSKKEAIIVFSRMNELEMLFTRLTGVAYESISVKETVKGVQ